MRSKKWTLAKIITGFNEFWEMWMHRPVQRNACDRIIFI